MDIKLCKTCEGQGTIESYIGVDTESSIVTCPKCVGHGRVYVREFTLEMPIGELSTIREKEELILKIIK